jgi:predicted nucleic-acid-binding Zn-ribbon protein
MMTTGVCPQCNSNTVYRRSPKAERYDRDTIDTEATPFVTYICATCGYYENYIVGQNKLQEITTNNKWEKIEPTQRFTSLDGSPVDPQFFSQLDYYGTLIQTGVEATASIVSMSRTKVRWYRSHDISGAVLDMTFDVTTPTGERFQSKTQSLTTDITLYKYEIGKQVIIKYDPSNKTQCAMIGLAKS